MTLFFHGYSKQPHPFCFLFSSFLFSPFQSPSLFTFPFDLLSPSSSSSSFNPICKSRGIGKLKESLPPHLLKEKLPRFLQRCVRTFESDKRYRNDLRYLRVWIQLVLEGKPINLDFDLLCSF